MRRSTGARGQRRGGGPGALLGIAVAAAAPSAVAGWGAWALSGSLAAPWRLALTSAAVLLALAATAAVAIWVAVTSGGLFRDPFGEYLRTGRAPDVRPAGPVVQGLTAVGGLALALLQALPGRGPRRTGRSGVRPAELLDVLGPAGAAALVTATAGSGLAVWTLGFPANPLGRAAVTLLAVAWAAVSCVAALLYLRHVRRLRPALVGPLASLAPLWLPFLLLLGRPAPDRHDR
ncbi:hypothetical protein ACGFX4_39425 [Kitasatospora sp. NPDC048365]|uniref:hypothetical protein n=1 Tax=Kitasatospora sp. NPDC048365 TaxID=3364050 RepID=UPI00371D9653